MPKTITKEVTLYTFKELVELEKQGQIKGACEKARQWLQEGATDHDWWEGVYNNWKEALEQIGLEDVDIRYSGFWSQGDGASFTCRVDEEKLIQFLSDTNLKPSSVITYDGNKEDFRGWILWKVNGCDTNPDFLKMLDKTVDCLQIEIERMASSYVHEFTCYSEVSYMVEEGSEIDKIGQLLRNAVLQLRLDICRAIYRDLETEYEWRTADEQLIEDAETNEWLFNESGEMETE